MKALHACAMLASTLLSDVAAAEGATPPREAGACQPAVSLLQSAYRRIEAGGDYDTATLLRENASESLVRALDAERSRTPDGEVGAIDFDVFTDSQDISLSDVRVGIAGAPSDGTCSVLATMLNYADPVRIRFSMRREHDAWKIDEVTALDAAGRPSWRLRELLAPPGTAVAPSSTTP